MTWLAWLLWLLGTVCSAAIGERRTVASTDDPQSPAHYYVCELKPEERLLILDALRRFHSSGRSAELLAAERAVQLAQRVDLPLPSERLDFDELERAAVEQGCSVVDVLWDRARAKEPE